MSRTRALAPSMIGRSAQLRELEQHLDLAYAGAGRVVFVVGDAGVGKTRLLREFAGRVRSTEGAAVTEGHCYDENPAPPYGPFADALRSSIRERGPEAVARAVGPWAADLSLILPEMEPLAPETRPMGDPQSQKRRLFEVIHRALQPHGAERCQLVILEDMHWSDQSSQELLTYLARAVERDPVLILATYRGDELHRRHPLTQLIAQLTHERRYHELRLAPLTRDELAGMLEATLERPLPGTFVDALYARTEGSPFFVEEILKALIARDRLDALIAAARRGHHSAQLDIPIALKDNILGRTADLDPTTAEVLRYAAVIGRRFDFELLLKLTGLAEPDLLRSVASLIERQLVIEERSGTEDRYSFRHALTREAIYDDMLGRDRRIKHRAVLQALEELYPENRDTVADQLAYHSLQAKELAQAGQYARLAGDKAVRMHAYREALAHYETALELLETDDPREKAGLLDLLAGAAWALEDVNLPLRYLQEAQRLYAQLGDRRKVGEISYWLGFATWSQGETEAAFAHTHAALAMLETEPPSGELAMAYGMLSRLFMLTSRPHESIAWGEKALHLAEALGNDDVRANALNNIGVSLVLLGEIQRGIGFMERSLELAKQVGASVFTTGRAYINLGAQLNQLGEFKRAAEVGREGIAFHHDLGLDPDLEWQVLGSAELELGQWDEAHKLLDRAVRAGELGIPTARLQALPSKAELLLRQGRLDEAQRLESALSECEKLDDPTIFGSFASALARVHLALGDLGQAVVVMDRGVAACREIGPLVGTEPTLGYGIEVYLQAGRVDQARELLDALMTIASRAASPLALARLDDARGLFAAHEGRHGDAAEHFRQAAVRWQAMAAPFEEAVSRRRLAESLLLAGNTAAREEARRELDMARAVFEHLGAPLELATADALIEKYSLAPQPAKPAPRKGDLTPREHQVIALIAQGHSNRQIAEALVISEKTAQIHVGNILGKLGFSSRAQAAAYAVQQGLVAPPAGGTPPGPEQPS